VVEHRCLSAAGLAVLQAPGLEDFPEEFRAGMRGRANAIGDVDASAPANWMPPFNSETPVHAMVIIAADDPEDLEERTSTIREIIASSKVQELGFIDGNARPGDQRGHEHFGFKDGISQPGIKGWTRSSKGGDQIAPGEFVGLGDPLTLDPFWATFERWSEAERAAAVGPVLNKLRPLLRPGLRGVLGQRSPRFELRSTFTEQKILLVPLRRGVIGPDAAGLLGSIVVAELWQAIQARSSLPAKQRQPVMVYIDEAQNYLNLPTDLADALAQARGYGVGFTLAHQFLNQFPREMRAAVLTNARSRVAFQVAHEDARVLERGHPELTAADLTSLGRFELYASLFARGQVQPFASGRSRPLPPATTDVIRLKARSRSRYGQPLDEIEQGFADLLEMPDTSPDSGRRRRT
jgi:hypothetical protein